MRTDFSKLDISRVPSLCFVVDEVAVQENLKILSYVQKQSGAKILGALKAFSMWSLATMNRKYLSGTCSSGLYELRLAVEEYGGESHVFSAAYSEEDFTEIASLADTVVFNSFGQWQRFRKHADQAKKERPHLTFGLRINPEHSEGDVDIYDPCAENSRLGITLSQFKPGELLGISGLHFHTLCEQGLPALQRTLEVVEEKFGEYLHKMTWVNFGGGHHITRNDYQVEELIETIKKFSKKYNVQVYLEPGEAIAIGCGVLVAEVLDLTWNGMSQAILNTSATCHMPDTLEMPYRADIIGAGIAEHYDNTYRLGGMTCLAGDVIGDYSFAQPLEVGQRIIFEDMAHYTMVKTSTFNGTKLPSIVLWNSQSDNIAVVKEFSFEDFKQRLS